MNNDPQHVLAACSAEGRRNVCGEKKNDKKQEHRGRITPMPDGDRHLRADNNVVTRVTVNELRSTCKKEASRRRISRDRDLSGGRKPTRVSASFPNVQFSDT